MARSAVIHCSDSRWGCGVIIDSWHEEHGWSSPSYPDVNIGYHRVILNGWPYPKEHNPFLDGMVEVGRYSKDRGAHVRGYNTTFGICMIGQDKFTVNQFISLRRVLKDRGLRPSEIKGHYELDSKKTCPNFNMNKFRHYYKTGDLKVMLPWISG
jgi:hypothetical protein